MRVYATNVPDVDDQYLDHSKIALADKVIKGITPLLDDVYVAKRDKLKRMKGELKAQRQQVVAGKEELEKLVSEYKRKKKVRKLLDRISKLVSSGLVYQGGMKNEFVVLLKICPKLNEEKLEHYLKQTMKTISKRFAK